MLSTEDVARGETSLSSVVGAAEGYALAEPGQLVFEATSDDFDPNRNPDTVEDGPESELDDDQVSYAVSSRFGEARSGPTTKPATEPRAINQEAPPQRVQPAMHRAPLAFGALALALSAATLTPAQAQRTRSASQRTEPHRAVLAVDHMWRDGGAYLHDTCNVEVALRLRGTSAQLHVTGTLERHSAELTPGGPSHPQHGRAEVDHVWSGTHHTDGLRRVIDFIQTTETAPATDPDMGLECSPELAEVGGQSERVLRCNVTPTPRWTTHPTTYLIAPIRFSLDARSAAIRNEVWLQDFGNERITLTHAVGRPTPARESRARR